MLKTLSIPVSTLVIIAILAVWSLVLGFSTGRRLDAIVGADDKLMKQLERLETRVDRLEKSRPISARPARTKGPRKGSAKTTPRENPGSSKPTKQAEPATSPTTPLWNSLSRLSAAASNFEAIQGALVKDDEATGIASYRCKTTVPGSQGVTIYHTPSGSYCEAVMHKSDDDAGADEKFEALLSQLDEDMPSTWSTRTENSADLESATGYSSDAGAFLIGVRTGDGDKGRWVVIRVEGE